jgi:putative endonuclease
MKRFVYIITDRNRKNLHVGMCTDLLKTLKFYGEMPNFVFRQRAATEPPWFILKR